MFFNTLQQTHKALIDPFYKDLLCDLVQYKCLVFIRLAITRPINKAIRRLKEKQLHICKILKICKLKIKLPIKLIIKVIDFSIKSRIMIVKIV